LWPCPVPKTNRLPPPEHPTRVSPKRPTKRKQPHPKLVLAPITQRVKLPVRFFLSSQPPPTPPQRGTKPPPPPFPRCQGVTPFPLVSPPPFDPRIPPRSGGEEGKTLVTKGGNPHFCRGKRMFFFFLKGRKKDPFQPVGGGTPPQEKRGNTSKRFPHNPKNPPPCFSPKKKQSQNSRSSLKFPWGRWRNRLHQPPLLSGK